MSDNSTPTTPTTPTAGRRASRDDRYKLIRINNSTAEFDDLLADTTETSDLLTGGINSMSASQQAFYHRLRFNFGCYTAAAAVSPLGHAVNTNGFTSPSRKIPPSLKQCG